MDPKPSGDETKDGSSSVTDVSLLGKRKGDETKDRSSSVNETCTDVASEDSDSDWDKDSFEGREYHSSDYSQDDSDEEFRRKCRNYHIAVIESKGFFEVSKDFPAVLWTGIGPVPHLDRPVQNSITACEFLTKLTCECVDKYNKRKMKNLKFEQVLRANFNPGGLTKYYITFAAKESESSDAPLVEYQAKVVWYAGESYPIFCRPSPPKKGA